MGESLFCLFSRLSLSPLTFTLFIFSSALSFTHSVFLGIVTFEMRGQISKGTHQSSHTAFREKEYNRKINQVRERDKITNMASKLWYSIYCRQFS